MARAVLGQEPYQPALLHRRGAAAFGCVCQWRLRYERQGRGRQRLLWLVRDSADLWNRSQLQVLDCYVLNLSPNSDGGGSRRHFWNSRLPISYPRRVNYTDIALQRAPRIALGSEQSSQTALSCTILSSPHSNPSRLATNSARVRAIR